MKEPLGRLNGRGRSLDRPPNNAVATVTVDIRLARFACGHHISRAAESQWGRRVAKFSTVARDLDVTDREEDRPEVVALPPLILK